MFPCDILCVVSFVLAERESKVRTRISEAGNDWAAYGEAGGLDPKTVRAHVQAVTQLIEVNQDMWLDSLKPVHFDRWRAAHNWSPGTFNRKLGEMRGFLEWCKRRGYQMPDSDVLYGWKSMKVPQRHRQRIPQREWGRLLDAAEHPLDRALVAAGLYLMARISELRTLRVRDLDLSAGEVQIYRHKTRRTDTMPVCMELEQEMRDWLTWYSSHAAVTPDSYLFPCRPVRSLNRDSDSGRILPLDPTCPVDPTRPITRPGENVQRVLRRAGYSTKNEGGHTLRRSGARAYYEELVETGHDGALRQVQTMLDHSNSIVTEVYLGTDRDKAERDRNLRGKRMFRPAAEVTRLEDHRGQASDTGL